jgi:hypothetical protein
LRPASLESFKFLVLSIAHILLRKRLFCSSELFPLSPKFSPFFLLLEPLCFGFGRRLRSSFDSTGRRHGSNSLQVERSRV